MSEQQQEQSLVLGDRINYPYILAMGMINFQQAIVKVEGEQSEQQVRESVLCEFNSIPAAWVDQDFIDELKKCTVEIEVDDRKEWCGRKVGKYHSHKEAKIDPYRLHHACIDLFHRRNLLSKSVFTEKATGKHVKVDKTEPE